MDKKKQGKKNRASGAKFELEVRKDLERQGWIVSKWQNNVEFMPDIPKPQTAERIDGKLKLNPQEFSVSGKLIPAKRKFNPFKKVLGIGTGFPDFIAFNAHHKSEDYTKMFYEVIGVEAKINGTLDKQEKEKCRWLLDNNIFSRIVIAKKGEKREIIYEDFQGEIPQREFNRS